MLNSCMFTIYFILGSIVRRIDGGWLKDKFRLLPIYHYIMWFLLGSSMLLIKSIYNGVYLKSYSYWIAILIYSVLFWWGHGGFFTVIEETPRGRKQPWKLLTRIICGEKYEYKIIGNYTGLTLGYTFYSFLVSIFIKNYLFIFTGILISTTYLILGLIWKQYFKNKDQEWIIKHWWDYTHYSEWVVGGIATSLLYLCA